MDKRQRSKSHTCTIERLATRWCRLSGLDRVLIIYSLGLLAIFIAIFLRSDCFRFSGHFASCVSVLRSIVYTALFVGWGMWRYHTVIHYRVRRYLAWIAGLMVFWMMVRTVKYLYLSDLAAIRLAWYLYYVAIMFIPVLSLFVMACTRRPEEWCPGIGLHLLFVIAGFFVAIVLTNDVHELFFRLSDDLNGAGKIYSYGPAYFLAMALVSGCALASVFEMVRRSRVPHGRRFVLLPLVIMVAATGYYLYYANVSQSSDLTVVSCFFIILIFESCILTHLISSNFLYDRLFFASTLCARIIDNKGDEVYLAGGGMPEEEHGFIWHAWPIDGGFMEWAEDMRKELALQQALRRDNARLESEQELIRAEINLKQSQETARQRKYLFERVTDEASWALNRINSLVLGKFDDYTPEELAASAAHLCVLGAYVKRRTNLIVLSELQETVLLEELFYCFRESSEYLHTAGREAAIRFPSNDNARISVETASQIYDWFAMEVEKNWDALEAVLVRLRQCPDGSISVRMAVEGPINVAQHDASTDIIEEDGACYFERAFYKEDESA